MLWKKNLFFVEQTGDSTFSDNIHPECEKIENVKLVKWDFNKKDPIWIDYDAHLDLNLIYSNNV
jgi:hypothetical protein